MGISIATVQGVAKTTNGETQDFTVSSFGTVKAYLVFSTKAITNNTAADEYSYSIGAGDGTREWVVTGRCEHNQGTTDKARRGTSTESVMWLNAGNQNVEGEANATLITDGIRLTFSNAPAAAYQITVVLFGGSDLSVRADDDSHTGVQDAEVAYTAPGFEPDVVFFGYNGIALNDSSNTGDDNMQLGVAANESGGIVQVMSGCKGTDNVGTSQEHSHHRTDLVSASLEDSNGDINRGLEVTAFTGGGTPDFKLTKRTGASDMFFGYLALSFGGAVKFDLEHLNTPTSGDLTSTALGGTPQFLMVMGGYNDSIDDVNNTNAAGAGTISISVIDANAEFCMGGNKEDAVMTTNTQSLVDAVAINLHDGAGTEVMKATGPSGLGSFGASGYTLDFTNNDATIRKWAVLSIEETAAAAPSGELHNPIFRVKNRGYGHLREAR